MTRTQIVCIVLVALIVMAGLDVGCYLNGVAHLRNGRCLLSTEIGYVMVPCSIVDGAQ